MTFHYGSADVETDTHAGHLGREKWRKDFIGFDRHAAAVIGHFEDGLRVGRRHREFHCLGIRLLAGLHRVFEKIEQNLFDHHGVAHKFVTGTQDANLDFHAEALGLNQGKFHGGRNDFVDRYGRDVGFTPFGFGKASDAADDVGGALRLVDDLGKRLGNAVFARAALLHHGQCRGGVVLHRSQRLVEFVGERTCHFTHGDEVRRAFGGLGLYLHQVFDFLSVGDIRDGEHFRSAFARPGQHAACHRQPTTVFLVMNFGRMADGGSLIEEISDAHVSFDTLPPVFAVERVCV